MLYPIHVNKDEGSAYGASFPDFPGCFAAADELQDLPRAAQESVEAHFYGETDRIPAPSAPEDWIDNQDFQGGYWMMVDIDLSKVNTKAVRLNISLPENLVHRIDEVAKARRLSRSAFLAMAAEHEMHAVEVPQSKEAGISIEWTPRAQAEHDERNRIVRDSIMGRSK